MEVEKTVQFLLQQRAVFPAQMTELRGVVHELAVNQVALGRRRSGFDSNMGAIQKTMGELQDNAKDLQERQGRTEETVRRMGERVDRLVKALEKRFNSNGSAA